jgi:autotransporter translocation and assembly factor TamB
LARSGWQQRVDSIEGQAVLSPTHLTLRRMMVQGPDGRATLNGTVSLTPVPSLQLALTADLPARQFAPLLPSGHTWNGTLGVDTKISGAWEVGRAAQSQLAKLMFTGLARGNALQMDDLSIGAFTAKFQMRDGRLAITDVTGALFGGRLTGQVSASLPPSSRHIDARLDLSDHRISPLLNRLFPSVRFPDGRWSGHLRAEGNDWSIDRLTADGELSFAVQHADPSPSGTGPPVGIHSSPTAPSTTVWQAALMHLSTATMAIHWQAPQLTIHRASIESRHNRLDVQGAVDRRGPLDLTFLLHLSDPGEIGEIAASTGFSEWEGTIDGRGSITGTWNEPELASSFIAHDLRAHGETIDESRGTIRYQASTVTFNNILFQQGSGMVKMAGTITIVSPDATVPPSAASGADRRPRPSGPEFHLSFTIVDAQPNRVIRLFGLDLAITGRTAGALTLTGRSTDMALHGTLRTEDGLFFGQHIAAAELALLLTPHGVDISRLTIKDGDGTLRAAGRIGFDGAYAGTITATTLSIDRLGWVSSQFPSLTGTLSGTVNGTGTWRQPHGEATFQLAALSSGSTTFGNGSLALSIDGEQLQIDAALDQPAMTLSGTVQLRGEFPSTVRVSVTQFPLVSLLRPLIPKWPDQITLLASGTGEASGSLRQPAHASGQFQFSSLSARLADYPIANDGPVQLSMQNGRLVIDRARFTGEGTMLGAEGSLTLFDRYDLFVHGEAELAILRLFFPRVTYGRGKGYLALQITDRWLDPKISGGIAIQEGLVRLESVDQPLTVSSASLFFDGRQLVMDNLSGGIGKGTVQASGRVTLQGFSPTQYRVLADITGVTIEPIEGFSGTVDGSLWLQGDFPLPGSSMKPSHVLKGDLHLVRATYSKRIDLKTLIVEHPAFEAVTIFTPLFLNEVGLQLHVWGRQSIWIRNNVAKIPLDVDLNVRGTVEHPVIVGRVSAAEGTLTFLHNPFQITSGAIDFFDPKETKPMVDIKARTTVRSYTVDLQLNGTPERFALDLSSDPPLSQADILSVLTTGRTTEEITTVSTGTLATSGAASLLVDEFIEERVQQFTGIDRFQIDPTLSSTNVTAAPRLTIGKQLLDNRLFVLSSVPLDASTEALYRMEYLFNRHISLVGERDENGRLGSDLKFRFEFQ